MLWVAGKSRLPIQDKIELINLILSAGGNVGEADGDDYRAIHSAAMINEIEIVRLLLKSGASVNLQCHHGMTPLHFCCSGSKNRDLAKLLLQFGADPNIKCIDGYSPIDLWPELTEIIKELKPSKPPSDEQP